MWYCGSVSGQPNLRIFIPILPVRQNMGKIKIKKKLRAQRKFAQGAIVPQQQNHSTPARSASHRLTSATSGPIIKNNFNVTTLLNVISLRGVHEAYHPIPYLDHQSPPTVEELSPDQPSAIKKKKFKVKDKGIKVVVKKQYHSSILRNRRSSTGSRASVSDSGEENQPLTYYQSKNNDETKTHSETLSPVVATKQAPLTTEPNTLNIDKNLDSNKCIDSSNLPSIPILTCREAHIPVTDVIRSGDKSVTGKKELKDKAIPKVRQNSVDSAPNTPRKSEDRTSTSSSDSAVSKASPDARFRSQRERRQVKTRKEFAYNPASSNNKYQKTDTQKRGQNLACKKSVLPTSRALKKLRTVKKRVRLEEFNKNKVKLVRGRRVDDELVTKLSGVPEQLFDDTDDESVERVSTWVSKIIRTVADDTEETSGENDSFKKPLLPARFRKRPSGLCPTRDHSCLMSLLESHVKADEHLCGNCQRCQLISKYRTVRDLLPQSEETDENTDILLNTPITDVYDFESDESGLKVVRRGRELVRNVLARNTFPYWLCNLDMHLNKDMFRDYEQLGKLKRNLSLPDDPQDDIILKIINRVDYLSQCIKEDKKESTSETSRKRLRSSGRPNTTATKDIVNRKKAKLLLHKQRKPVTLLPVVKLTPIEPEKTVEVDKPSQVLRPVVCLTPLEILKPDDVPPDSEMSPELIPQRRGRKNTKFTFVKPFPSTDTSNSDSATAPTVKENNHILAPQVVCHNILNLKAATENNVPVSQAPTERIIPVTQVSTENSIILDRHSTTKKNLIPALQGTTDKKLIPVPQVTIVKNLIPGLQSSALNNPISAQTSQEINDIPTFQVLTQNNLIPTPHVTIEKITIPQLQAISDKILIPIAQVTTEKKNIPTQEVLEKNITASKDAKEKYIIRVPQVTLEKNSALPTQAITEKNFNPISQFLLGKNPVTIPQAKNYQTTSEKNQVTIPKVILEKNPALLPQTTKNQAPQSTREKSQITIPQVTLEKSLGLISQASKDKVPLVALEKSSASVAQASKKNISPSLQSAKEKNGISISQVTVDVNVVAAHLPTSTVSLIKPDNLLTSQCLPQDAMNHIVAQAVKEKNFAVSQFTLEKSPIISQGTNNPVQAPTANVTTMATIPTTPNVPTTTNVTTMTKVLTSTTVPTIPNIPTTTTVPVATIPEAVKNTSAIVNAESTKRTMTIDLTLTTDPTVTTEPTLTTDPIPTANPTPKPPIKIGQVVGAPVFRPTEEEFKDPIGYIEKIESEAAVFGICKIVPPDGCKIPYHLDQTVMFKTTNQYVGRLYQRWGATARVMATIQVLMALTEKSDKSKQPPNLDGIEVDLVKLYRLVRDRGGIQELMGDRAQWLRVAEEMSLVADKARATLDGRKLEKIYIKNILPYESLSDTDRMKIHAQVDKVWTERLRRGLRRASRPLHYQRRLLGDTASSDDDESPTDEAAPVRQLGKHVLDRAEECLSHTGRTNLDSFRKRAGDLQHMRFPDNPSPSPQEVEDQYWRLLCLCKEHVVVQTAAIDTSVGRMGHEADPLQPGGSHPWNMKRVTESPRNVLRSLGKSLSVTVPTLCLNHLFSTNCWHMDPHQLAWMDCMHEGKPKIWYAVAARHAMRFRHAMEAMAPSAVQRKGLWLPSDTAMVPPALLSLHGVNMTKVYQEPGEYIVVFPGAYFSSIATGLSISESIYFGSLNWLRNMDRIFDEMREDCEPSMFSRAALVLRIAAESAPEPRAARRVLPSLRALVQHELTRRRRALALGMRLLRDESGLQRPSTTSWPNQPECSLCRVPLVLSKTNRIDNRSLVCLTHGLRLFELTTPSERPKVPPPVTLLYSDQRLTAILRNLEARVQGKSTLLKGGVRRLDDDDSGSSSE